MAIYLGISQLLLCVFLRQSARDQACAHDNPCLQRRAAVLLSGVGKPQRSLCLGRHPAMLFLEQAPVLTDTNCHSPAYMNLKRVTQVITNSAPGWQDQNSEWQNRMLGALKKTKLIGQNATTHGKGRGIPQVTSSTHRLNRSRYLQLVLIPALTCTFN